MLQFTNSLETVIGITVVVAGDSYFVTLFVVIVFHQMFEGIALGSRIAAVGHHHHHHHVQGTENGTGAGSSGGSSHTQTTHLKGEDSVSGTGGDTEGNGMPNTTNNGVSSAEATATGTTTTWKSLSMTKKLLMALAFAITTPIGMAIGIGVLNTFNGNDPTTLWAIGTLDAFSAGILVWVGVVEMWAGDWMFGGELANATPLVATLGLVGFVAGMALMSFLGKWA